MDFKELLQTYGLWPATTLIVCWVFYRHLVDEIADLKRERDALRAAAAGAVQAKDMEIQEWKTRALAEAKR